MWIGSQLYQDGKITAEQFATAVCTVTNRQERIGEIALKNRHLTVKQVMAILAEQDNSPASKFGEVAISLGFLNRDRLMQILGEQTLASPSISEVLLELGYVSEEELSSQFDESARTICCV
ncbi:MAG: hypothetical protein Aurels2KO_55050 [Aureliella sp.]